MTIFQQLALGEAKKRYAHDFVDSITVKYSYNYYMLHNWVEYLSRWDKVNTFYNAYRNW